MAVGNVVTVVRSYVGVAVDVEIQGAVAAGCAGPVETTVTHSGNTAVVTHLESCGGIPDFRVGTQDAVKIPSAVYAVPLSVERNVDFPQSGFEKGATRRWRSKVSKSGYHSKFLSIF